VPVQCGGVQEDDPREAWQHGLGNAARHIPGPFVTPMLHYQERMAVLLQDGPQLGRKAKALLTSRESRSSVLEDARADAGDKEDPELLQVGVAVSERAASPRGR